MGHSLPAPDWGVEVLRVLNRMPPPQLMEQMPQFDQEVTAQSTVGNVGAGVGVGTGVGTRVGKAVGCSVWESNWTRRSPLVPTMSDIVRRTDCVAGPKPMGLWQAMAVWLSQVVALHIVDDIDADGEPAWREKLMPLTTSNAPPLQGRFMGVKLETTGASKLICPLQVPTTRPRVTTDENGSALS